MWWLFLRKKSANPHEMGTFGKIDNYFTILTKGGLRDIFVNRCNKFVTNNKNMKTQLEAFRK